MAKKPNNVKFFNRLTHDEKGNVLSDVTDMLLSDHKSYKLIKKLYSNGKGIKIKNAKVINDKLHFYLLFKFEDYIEKFINENNEIEYKNKKYKVIFKKKNNDKQQIIEVFFD